MAVLVAGGAGYIGSHTAIELLESGYEVVIVDNLSNSNSIVVDRIRELSGKQVKFYNIDITNKNEMHTVFKENNIESIIHFAALKAVGESVEKPIEYYSNNLISTLNLFELMREYGVKKFVFSSSATVYGDPHTCPILEDFPLSVTNPYGRTKLMIEQMLVDISKADESLDIALLRYFNPVGAHKSGRIGEEPNGIPSNLMPYITKIAVGKLKELSVYGNDYPTHDGTGVRDYIHVLDLAAGHVKALQKLEENPGLVVYNLGTGKGYSVLDLVKAFSKASGKEIPYKIVGRRAGDVAMCYADSSKAEKELGWKAKYELEEMCQDSWRWQSMNPNGYEA
ncbi:MULTISPECIES: UDP-glucose 4-epimerase GalE [unclassified Clostridioides]|uniref:UDP-glucose 4-epimerase GalE n=1 Tax=unclassified Clostridioides TaxID=2635829 RepID=UPI001D0CDC8A|nr:UDP-glucose 4-epimerase GalE [Clostridioides sp. ES-S-0001-02]MCC0641831.1 UDP-glucose 4-epimerase GalE [Clostridioides sp. ES-S-0049-03]MCC0652702.1 UDP-glucose 4-epimerase GalE [Clostridioides sp. ES-S-0001-03]MCC0672271.1 UDP-glucose 4-epimerase GalE [Clostridioides sp. ES-S-0145-01]MCC0677973.1 UDP-glucose 4-epimerase GalE [Clostridioides sp. ES-W-0018-02]MCC0680444.1 UDP-glucose 4-epimerase GalE [Clostridioides sp. ES-S-0005-03]MCC0707317.1 UDP-glucose 4-epimerase GalE [Clostridioides